MVAGLHCGPLVTVDSFSNKSVGWSNEVLGLLRQGDDGLEAGRLGG